MASLAPYQWEENVLTWNNYSPKYVPEGGDSAPYGSILDASKETVNVLPINAWESFNVTKGIQKILDKEVENYGFMLTIREIFKKTTATGFTLIKRRKGGNFASSEYADPALRPKLIITYSPTNTKIHNLKTDDLSSVNTFIDGEMLRINTPNRLLTTVEIYNTQGKLILEQNFESSSNIIIPLGNHVGKGIYFMKIRNNKNSFLKSIRYQ